MTGVQTCALPISAAVLLLLNNPFNTLLLLSFNFTYTLYQTLRICHGKVFDFLQTTKLHTFCAEPVVFIILFISEYFYFIHVISILPGFFFCYNFNISQFSIFHIMNSYILRIFCVVR